MLQEFLDKYRFYIGIVLILIIIGSGIFLLKGQKEEGRGYKVSESKEESLVTIQVDIEGGVKKPGVYELPKGSILEDLINAAGGLVDNVDSNLVAQTVNRAQKLKDGDKFYIPIIGDEVSQQAARGGVTLNQGSGAVYGEQTGLVNINSADQKTLESLPGIGPVKAAAIISYRESHGGFKSISEIKNVKGIGDKTFEKLKDLITT